MNQQKGIAFQISSLQQTGGLQWRWSFIRRSITQATAQPVLQACCTNWYENSTVLNNLWALRQLRLQHTKRKSASVSEFCFTYEYTPFVASDFIKMIIFLHFINVNFLHIFIDLKNTHLFLAQTYNNGSTSQPKTEYNTFKHKEN